MNVTFSWLGVGGCHSFWLGVSECDRFWTGFGLSVTYFGWVWVGLGECTIYLEFLN